MEDAQVYVFIYLFKWFGSLNYPPLYISGDGLINLDGEAPHHRSQYYSIEKPTFSLVWPVKVKLQALDDNPVELVLFRSQSFKELSVDAETRVSESKNFT